MPQLTTAPENIRSAPLKVQLLYYLDFLVSKDACDAVLQADGLTIGFSNLAQLLDTNGTPICNCYCAFTDQGMFIALGGALSNDAARSIWNAYMGYITSPIEEPVNSVFTLLASRLDVIIPFTYFSVSTNFYIFGYSAGGAIATFVPGAMLTPDQQRNCLITTFGAPQPGGRRNFVQSSNLRIARYMNADDAVPSIPPTISTYHRIVTLGIRYDQGARLNNFRQVRGGVQIGLDGRVSQQAYPQSIDWDRVVAIQSWMRSASQNRDNAHSISTYIARVQSAIALLPSQQTQVETDGSGGGTDFTSEAQARTQISAIQTQFQAQYPSTSTSTVVIPSDQLFYAAKKARTWYTYLGGTIIATAPHKRGARQLARLGNAFLRSLQARGQVNVEELADQFRAYLEAASTPGSGFVPSINGV